MRFGAHVVPLDIPEDAEILRKYKRGFEGQSVLPLRVWVLEEGEIEDRHIGVIDNAAIFGEPGVHDRVALREILNVEHPGPPALDIAGGGEEKRDAERARDEQAAERFR